METIKKNFKKGFTVAEMVVSIAIITIISSLVVLNYPGLSEDSTLRRASQNIISNFRLAQNYATAVKEFNTGVFPGYGIHFDTGNDTKYLIFADVNNNKIYDGLSEKVEEFNIENSIKISDVCGNANSDPLNKKCFSISLSDIDVVFLRPDPKLFFKGDGGIYDFSDVSITVKSPHGKTKSVIVWKIGQIYFQ